MHEHHLYFGKEVKKIAENVCERQNHSILQFCFYLLVLLYITFHDERVLQYGGSISLDLSLSVFHSFSVTLDLSKGMVIFFEVFFFINYVM